MKTIFLIAFVLLAGRGFGQIQGSANGYTLLTEKWGDLDKDGIAEKVIVYNTTDSTDDGVVREIQILKLKNGISSVWKKSRAAIRKSQEGGMMGDPFEEIEIANGILIIHFSGGSSWKWWYSDKYRFQNDEFELIGYSGTYGKLCEYWQKCDFNLTTGKVIFKKEYEDCDRDQKIIKTENETFSKPGIKLNLNNRNTQEIKLVSPKYKHEIYL